MKLQKTRKQETEQKHKELKVVSYFSSESVGRGHPDKICDQISDSILDEAMKQDKNSRVAIETMASNGLIVIGGEIKTNAKIDYKKKAREILREVGYKDNDFKIILNVNKQSPDITGGVEKNGVYDVAAGDQGIMFGYATNETPEMMPPAIMLAHKLLKRAEYLRKSGKFKWAGADMKAQVTIKESYDSVWDFDWERDGLEIETVLMSIQHDENYNKAEFESFIKHNIIYYVIKKNRESYKIKGKINNIYINPSGRFVLGGPAADTGLTGRKIIVDTYGGSAPHGGGAFSGKDYTKVDRSAAYMCRYIGKHLISPALAKKVLIQLSYGIGMIQPLSVKVNTFDSGLYLDQDLEAAIKEVFDLSVRGIEKTLNLSNTKMLPSSYFGHFGRKGKDFPWEQVDKNKVKQLLQFLEKNGTLKAEIDSDLDLEVDDYFDVDLDDL